MASGFPYLYRLETKGVAGIGNGGHLLDRGWWIGMSLILGSKPDHVVMPTLWGSNVFLGLVRWVT